MNLDSSLPNILTVIGLRITMLYVLLPKTQTRCLSTTEIYVGSLEGVEQWLRGFEWARNYDMMHNLSTDEKRSAAEQKERNRQLMRTLKEGKRVEGKVK
jgi:hypothetical protein